MDPLVERHFAQLAGKAAAALLLLLGLCRRRLFVVRQLDVLVVALVLLLLLLGGRRRLAVLRIAEDGTDVALVASLGLARLETKGVDSARGRPREGDR